MHMIVIWTISFVLACLPLLMAIFFFAITLPRKVIAVKQDLNKLRSYPSGQSTGPSTASSKIVSELDIDALVAQFYSKWTLSIPAFRLTLFYGAAFVLGDAYINQHFNAGNSWFFPKKLIDIAGPILYTFTGVYLFNLGNLIRRIYLGDLNEQVFWGAINRLWLSLGLGLVVRYAGFPANAEPGVFFTIGFIANVFLNWLLDKTLKLLNINQPKTEDLPLQMVKGINIWKEYRLEEEGIENVQNLATSDVTELTVRTHYNFRTLIDWIDQALLLTRLTNDQAKILTAQATAISAIELAAEAPKATGNAAFATALATKLNVDPTLIAATLNRLYEDQYVQDLWNLWQSGKEGGTLPTAAPPPPPPPPPPAAAAAAAAGAGASGGVVTGSSGGAGTANETNTGKKE